MPIGSCFTFQTFPFKNAEELAFHTSGDVDAAVKMMYFHTSQCPPTTGDTIEHGYLLRFGTLSQKDVSAVCPHSGGEVFFWNFVIIL